MSEIKDFGMMICGAAVLCAVVNMLVPSEKYEKVIKITLAAVMICAMITPLTKLSRIRLDLSEYRASDRGYYDDLRQKIEIQTESVMQKTVTGMIHESLQKNGIRAKNIFVETDRLEDGSISIGQVTIETQNNAEAIAAKKIIKDSLGIDADVASA